METTAWRHPDVQQPRPLQMLRYLHGEQPPRSVHNRLMPQPIAQQRQFSVTAAGTSPAYQWEISTDGGLTYTAITGANGATPSLSAVTFIHEQQPLPRDHQ